MKHVDVNGKKVTLFLLHTTTGGQDEWAAITGTIEVREQDLYFHSAPDVTFCLPADTLDRIKIATPELKKSEGSDLYLPLKVQPPPENANEIGEFVRTGLSWPETNE